MPTYNPIVQSPDARMTDTNATLARWFAELRRRKVVRVAVVYIVIAWLLIQVADATFEPIGLPTWANRLVIVLAASGFPARLRSCLGVRCDAARHRAHLCFRRVGTRRQPCRPARRWAPRAGSPRSRP